MDVCQFLQLMYLKFYKIKILFGIFLCGGGVSLCKGYAQSKGARRSDRPYRHGAGGLTGRIGLV